MACLAAILIFTLVAVASAQIEPLEFGVTKFSSLSSAGEIDTYSFTANAGDSIYIKIVKTSGDLYPRITLYSPEGDALKSAHGSQCSVISEKVTKAGTYTILADDYYSGARTGDYSIFCQRVNNPSNIEKLQFGVSKSASLEPAGETDTYTFTINAGDSIYINMVKTSGNLYPRITMYSPEGDALKSAHGSQRSVISEKVTKAGTCTILADDYYSGARTGSYSIFVQRTSAEDGVASTPIVSPESTQPSESQTQTSTPQPSGGTQIPETQAKYPEMYFIVPLLVVILLIAVLAGVKYRGRAKKEREEPIEKTKGEPIESLSMLETPIPPPSEEEKKPSRRISGHDVFICYSSKDKTVADAMVATLESKGIRCWIAPRDVLPGISFQEAIIDAIDSTRIMVLIFSSHSNNSPHIIRELTEAVSKSVIIIPFRIEDVLPSKSMKYLISVPHWLDAYTPPLEQHLKKLAETIQLLLNKEKTDSEEDTT